MVPSVAVQDLDSTGVGDIAVQAGIEDGAGLRGEPHPPGKKGPGTHDLGGNTPVLADGMFPLLE